MLKSKTLIRSHARTHVRTAGRIYCGYREKLFEKIRRGNLSYPRYLSAHAQQILQGVSSINLFILYLVACFRTLEIGALTHLSY